MKRQMYAKRLLIGLLIWKHSDVHTKCIILLGTHFDVITSFSICAGYYFCLIFYSGIFFVIFLNQKRYIKTFLLLIFANYTINMIPWHLCLFHILDLNFTRLGIYRYHFEHGTFFSPVITTLNEASLMSWRSLQSQLIQESKFVFQWSIFEIILSVNNFLMRTVIDRIVEFIYTIIAKWFLLLNILCISLKANGN